ncbi:putative baseplate assembly protein [Nonomuraea jiangxiensis]|uniref:Putative baseplate assembly protein n=1 Tax=Nonomuraea jiangxiensis TaxID=633440 RepID=A0A1G9EXV1_9ACTN|nr:putative baseplate assembly protein [Nonomuraea jiangxiensis]SDK80913.1 putative baseplate assembly protein [Nonomuraea jiangxiensis]
MPFPLPRLDDRRWRDLVDEARSLIPYRAPGWTDHNVSDPGITLAELFAWVAEMDLFQLDQISDRLRQTMLSLVGLRRRPAVPATVTLALSGDGVVVPATTELAGPHGLLFRTLEPVLATGVRLTSVEAAGGKVTTGSPFTPFTRPGEALVLGFSEPLPPGTALAITAEGTEVVTRWEGHLRGRWRSLEVEDGTLGLSRSGSVRFRTPGAALIRCAYVGGDLDAPPVVRELAVNGVRAEQATPIGTLTWPIAPGAVITGTVRPGTTIHAEIRLDGSGAITHLETGRPGTPGLFVLDRSPAHLTVEACLLGRGDDAPGQRHRLPAAPVAAEIWTLEPGWRRWRLRDDLGGSGPADAHAVLDPLTGLLSFGDGERGRVPPRGAPIVALARRTGGAAGNRAEEFALADTPHNRALGVTGVRVAHVSPAAGGADAESVADTWGRAEGLLDRATRAITLADCEELAAATPGVRLARVTALAGVHPALPGVPAPGVITVVLVPYLPAGRPVPSPRLLRAVARHLCRHRPLGSRFELTGPVYTEVSVRARLRVIPAADPAAVRQDVLRALDAWLDPLTWPLGRDVHRTEALAVLDQVPGVDRVSGVELLAGGEPACGDLRVGPLGLVTAGEHTIEVERACD